MWHAFELQLQENLDQVQEQDTSSAARGAMMANDTEMRPGPMDQLAGTGLVGGTSAWQQGSLRRIKK